MEIEGEPAKPVGHVASRRPDGQKVQKVLRPTRRKN